MKQIGNLQFEGERTVMRRRGLRSQITNRKLQIRSRGYMLITLMLAFALIAIVLLTALPEIGQQIKRDREEEFRHRGTAYMRAIQHFYRKFGRYPSSLDELESTNNLRFLRKRYTDPMNVDRATGKEKDFKLLHQMDIGLNNGPVLGQTPGQSGLPGPGGLPGQGGPPGQGALGGMAGQLGGPQPTGNTGAQISGSSSSGDASPGNSSSGNSDTGGNSNQPGSSSSSSNSGSGFNGPTFGGGPVLGVASASKEKTIRVFYGKNHYNDWLFFYLPAADRGGLLTGPVNPGIQATAGGLTPGVGGGAPGQGGLGLGLGQGLTPNGGQNQGFQTQAPPTPAPTPQQ
jgi:type II secretory pathway pseudopilin PulG